MLYGQILAAGRTAVTTFLSNPFLRRLTAALLVTGLDVTVLLIAGRNVLAASPIRSWLGPAFCIVSSALLLSLGHVWLLTLRARRSHRAVQLVLDFNKGKQP